MAFRILIAAVVATAWFTPLAALKAQTAEMWVTPGAHRDCSVLSAAATSFSELRREGPDALAPSNRCVSIDGIMVGGLLLEDAAARYRLETVQGDPSSNGAILGLYGAEPRNRLRRVRVTGTLGNCAEVERLGRAIDGGDLVNLSGYCHSFSGKILTAVTVQELGPAQLERLLPASAGAAIGNLSPLADSDTRRQMMRAAERFLRTLRDRDRALLATLHGGGPDGRRNPRDLERVLAILLDDPGSPFAALQTRGAVTIEIFGWKPPLWADDAWRAQTARSGAADAIACFSERSDVAALWPIDSKDADNVPGRPYACTRVHIGSTGMDAPASFDTEQAPGGVAEPVR